MSRKSDVNYQAPSFFPKRINVPRGATLYSYPFKRDQIIESKIERVVTVVKKSGATVLDSRVADNADRIVS